MSDLEFTPLEEAAAQVGLHQSIVDGYIRQGRLRRWHRPGDARTFVDIEELRQLRELKSPNPQQ